MIKFTFHWYLAILLACRIKGFEENLKFCIHTDERISEQHRKSDIARPLETDKIPSKCDIVVQTLNKKEKIDFFNTMCKGGQGTNDLKEFYYYFKYCNGSLSGRGTHRDICINKNNPLLAWLPYQQLQRYFIDEMDPKESINYMAKAKDNEHNKSDLCHFRHSDLVNNISENLFTCFVMIHEDNFYDLNDDINVLIEIQPLMYEIRNITYTPWINSTASYKSLLGKALLKNRNQERKNIFGSLNYAYVEKVAVNLSSLYGTNDGMDKLSLLFEHKNVIIKLDEQGEGGIDVNDKIFYGRKLESRTQVSVNLVGQWFEHCQQFNADIYEDYGFGIRRFRQELHSGQVTFTRIDSAEPVYEVPQIYESNVVADKSKHFARLRAKGDAIGRENITNLHNTFDNPEFTDDLETDSSTDGHPNIDSYYPWFVLTLLLVGIVILAIIIAMANTCNNTTKPQKRYKFSVLKRGSYPVNC